MDGRMVVAAWQAWKDSPEGQNCSNPETLGNTLSARQYLENRLERAFQAGVKAAENAEILEFNRKHAGK